MSSILSERNSIALEITLQAVIKLFQWADENIDIQNIQHNLNPENFTTSIIDINRIAEAQELFQWTEKAKIKPLSLLFDRVKLDNAKTKIQRVNKDKKYLSPLCLEEDLLKIPYPQTIISSEQEENYLKEKIKNCANNLQPIDWNNLDLLLLILEKYGSFLSLCESEDKDDIALIDLVRTTAAVAVVLPQNNETEYLSLIAGDLSGIQDFIYTISSDGALKSLRARSFFLELVIEEIVQQLLDELQLPRTNIIYAGGGNFYILAPGDKDLIKKVVAQVSDRFNKWLFASFKEKVFLALDYLLLPKSDLKSHILSKQWGKINRKLAIKKNRKFDNQIASLLKPKPAYEPCRVCFRDDIQKLKPLSNDSDGNSPPACWVCRRMFSLGNKLLNTKAIVRTKCANNKGKLKLINNSLDDKLLGNRLVISGYYYYLYDDLENALKVKDDNEILLINNWQVDSYRKKTKIIPLVIGNYGDRIKEEQEDNHHFYYLL